MKKLLFLFAIIFVPFNMSAQWDDVYYTPSKKSKTERAASNNTRSAAEEGFFEKQIKESNTGDYSSSSKQVSNLLSLPNGVYNVVVNKYTISFEDENLGTATNIYNLEDGYYTIYAKGFLHATDANVGKQVEWINEYKVRERLGKDYYFILEDAEERYGLIRIYSIREDTFTLGSWTMKEEAPLSSIIAITLMAREIAFEILGLNFEDSYDGVNVENKKVLKYVLSWGMKIQKRYCNELGEIGRAHV